uniref:Small ribosomal subunit protein uS14c n=2 Tax=Gelidium TaxID=2811 RepID=A0A411FT04_9FLOR|nr:ribosomal protein S14 [Gelidium coulteri]YP_009565182.1 ribosomal protein S14 [Gelidium sinicola]QBA96133.1 ribosomal protein S14 [Gelidium coulteri]QBA96533.1 ribosomal protein S14 [Gelidium sinicola]
MAKISMIERENKRKKLTQKYQDRRRQIKQSIKQTLDFTEKIKLQEDLQKLPRNSSPCRIRNRCWMTGRSRGFYRDFGLSRHVVREMSHECLLPGVTKSSW